MQKILCGHDHDRLREVLRIHFIPDCRPIIYLNNAALWFIVTNHSQPAVITGRLIRKIIPYIDILHRNIIRQNVYLLLNISDLIVSSDQLLKAVFYCYLIVAALSQNQTQPQPDRVFLILLQPGQRTLGRRLRVTWLKLLIENSALLRRQSKLLQIRIFLRDAY